MRQGAFRTSAMKAQESQTDPDVSPDVLIHLSLRHIPIRNIEDLCNPLGAVSVQGLTPSRRFDP